MNLEDPLDGGALRLLRPTHFEYDPNDVFAIDELRNRVLCGLVLLEKSTGSEDLAANGTWADISDCMVLYVLDFFCGGKWDDNGRVQTQGTCGGRGGWDRGYWLGDVLGGGGGEEAFEEREESCFWRDCEFLLEERGRVVAVVAAAVVVGGEGKTSKVEEN